MRMALIVPCRFANLLDDLFKMNSALYEGNVTHIRYLPFKKRFDYSLFMLFLDLQELPHLFESFWFWSAQKWNIAYFRRSDHMGDPSEPLSDSVRNWVFTKTGKRPEGRIFLMTHLCYFGYRFNPVSFYYCFDSSESNVQTIIAEINNTPWGEQFCYLLDCSNSIEKEGMRKFFFKKEFHISPFMDMDLDYEWQFSEPKEHLKVCMSNIKEGEKTFEASLLMKKKPINSKSLTRALLKYPLITWKIKAAIYYQAFKLWHAKCPFYPHPKNKMSC